jgi:hypothetical protein
LEKISADSEKSEEFRNFRDFSGGLRYFEIF